MPWTTSRRRGGHFASFRPLKSDDPEPFVHDFGLIILPLQEPQARKTTGKGSETIVDTTVRKTWEMDPKHFELRSPCWVADLQKICAAVASDMGIKSPTTAGCPGTFGTLVVCLPSAHMGGGVVVKHAGQTKSFKASGAAESFACWCSDVHREVRFGKGARLKFDGYIVSKILRAAIQMEQRNFLRALLASFTVLALQVL
ncbi:2OG-Fe oxygenase family protein [Colletotrichum tofieldiae]|nr:2OG-Fe oxygenase family protein [Colletotrichum tofieldiae]GKT69645.1 2OG-Fe oxygenase family protein [Colletotrichum tofieldiae]